MLLTFGYRVAHTLCNFIIYEAPHNSLSYFLRTVCKRFENLPIERSTYYKFLFDGSIYYKTCCINT